MSDDTKSPSGGTRTGSRCDECAACIPAYKVTEMFGQNIGGPVCGAVGHILGRIDLDGSQQGGLYAAFAKDCDKFTKVAPITAPTFPKARVANPNMEALKAGPSDELSRPKSCSGCKHFVPESIVYSELKWTAGLCSLNGRLLFKNRYEHEAEDCDYGVSGAPRDTTDGIELLSKYEEGEMMGVALGASVGAHSSPFGDVDPRDYPTDAPVEDSDKAIGVRAWRVINDPEGYGAPVKLPIFDYNSFTDELERNTIPVTGEGDSPPELYVDHMGYLYGVAAVLYGRDGERRGTPAFWGDAGVGKTEFFRYLAWLGVMPFERISITSSTTADELFGTWLFMEGATVFREGRIPRAWRRNVFSLLDEPNTAEPDLWQRIRPIIDSSKQLVLDGSAYFNKATGEWIVPPPIDPGPYHFLGMAMNPAWDPKYTGLENLSAAEVSRLTHMKMEYPPVEIERDILARSFMRKDPDGNPPKAKLLDEIMGIATDLRAMAAGDNPTLTISWGIREQLKVMELIPFFPLEKAYRHAVCDYLEPQTGQLIMGVVAAHHKVRKPRAASAAASSPSPF